MVKHINESDFFKETNLEGVVLVDFFATWCPPCKMLLPILEDISNSRKYKIVKINIDENPNIVNRFKIDTVPTLVVFKDGKPVEKSIGYIDRNEVIALMDKHFE
jgi:thioredoxin 1